MVRKILVTVTRASLLVARAKKGDSGTDQPELFMDGQQALEREKHGTLELR